MRGSYERRRAASPARALALAATLLALGCDALSEREPDETARVDEELAAVLPELVDAVQAKQPLFVMEHVSYSFRDERGLDYFDVRALVDDFAFRDEVVGARLESISITPAENGAQRVAARVAFALGTRLAPGAPLPSGAVVYRLDLLFAKQDGRWQAQSGSYARE